MRVLCRFWVLVLAGLALSVQAHDSRPLVVDLIEKANGRYEVSWKIPSSVQSNQMPSITLSGNCEIASPGGGFGGHVHERSAFWICEHGTKPDAVLVDYAEGNPSLSTLLRFDRLDFPVVFINGKAGERDLYLPDSPASDQIGSHYLGMGIGHILSGFDHLLFLLCLLAIARSNKRILLAVTGFTIAHSITLALSVLKIISVPVPLVESLIALSIVFLASELLREHRDTLVWRFPTVVSLLFGLLHGLGFAEVLKEIGLPQNDVFFALVSFNVGVEIGQLLFIAAVLGIGFIVSRLAPPILESKGKLLQFGSYSAGTLAAVWFWQRAVLLVN